MTVPPTEKPDMYLRNLQRETGQIILHTDGILCATTDELVNSGAFKQILYYYLDELEKRSGTILRRLPPVTDPGGRERLLTLFRNLAGTQLEHAVKIMPDGHRFLEDRRALNLLVEGFYDFWRAYDRFLICHSEQGPHSHDQRPYRTFNRTVEKLTDLVRALYRDICEHITGDRLRIYRQVSAGCNLGVIAVQKEWDLPSESCSVLKDIPFIRQVLINPPLILDPPENKRTGEFKRVDTNPLANLRLEADQWLCYPAQVGPQVIFIYFHQRFMGLGCSLANLFELATEEQIAAGPDAVYLYVRLWRPAHRLLR